jgi:DNA-binding GntR family transcriptional regulator
VEVSSESTPASLRAYKAIERLIVTLELAPGATTTEGALAERLGFGRTPLREALQRLAWEGLIEVRPRSGIAVSPLVPGDWLRVVDARAGVEAVLARSAARFASSKAVAELQAAAQSMYQSVLSSDVIGFLEADKALDDLMAQAADNPYAARVAAPLQTHSRRFWFRYRRDTGLAEAAGYHVELIGAIMHRDEEAAAIEAGRLMTMLRGHALAAARP